MDGVGEEETRYVDGAGGEKKVDGVEGEEVLVNGVGGEETR